MKKTIFILLFLTCIKAFSQKNNYSFISYDDPYLHKILSYNLSVSEYLFFGEIKSVYIEMRDKSGNITGNNSKRYFDKQRNNVKIINYRTQNDFSISEFYYKQENGEYPVYKYLTEHKNGIVENIITSNIDTINQIIINYYYSKGELNEIDSIYYTKDFKPIERRKISVKFIDKSYTKIAYNEYGKIYKKAHKRSTSSFGRFIKYNELGKRSYVYEIKYEEFDSIQFDNCNSNKIKIEDFIWINDKSFELNEVGKGIISFKFEEKKLIENNNGQITTVIFNGMLLPIKQTIDNQRYDTKLTTNFKYNEFNDLIFKESTSESVKNTITYKYVYDHKKNWTERKEFLNGELLYTTIRRIEY